MANLIPNLSRYTPNTQSALNSLLNAYSANSNAINKAGNIFNEYQAKKLQEEKNEAWRQANAREAEKFQMLKDKTAQDQANAARTRDSNLATNRALLATANPNVAAQEYVSPETSQALLDEYNKTGDLSLDRYNQMISSPEAVNSSREFLLGDTRADSGKIIDAQNSIFNRNLRTPGTEEYNNAQKALLANEEAKIRLQRKYATPKAPSTNTYYDKSGNMYRLTDGEVRKALANGTNLYDPATFRKQFGESRTNSSVSSNSKTIESYNKIYEDLSKNKLDWLGSGDTEEAIATVEKVESLGVPSSVVERALTKMRASSVDQTFDLEDLDAYIPPVIGDDGKKITFSQAIDRAEKEGRQVVYDPDTGGIRYSDIPTPSNTSTPTTIAPSTTLSTNQTPTTTQSSGGILPTGQDVERVASSLFDTVRNTNVGGLLVPNSPVVNDAERNAQAARSADIVNKSMSNTNALTADEKSWLARMNSTANGKRQLALIEEAIRYKRILDNGGNLTNTQLQLIREVLPNN